jgi:predicted HicB family RNase H-like nuclease
MDMDIQTQAPDDYSGALYLRCPPSLPQAIRQAARGNMTSASSYIRGAILSQLKRDGYAPNGDAA